jgi:uncharacterized iron-regulated membrane protein
MPNTRKQARRIRWFRWIHRKLAIILFVFFFIMSVSGLLLGIKKQTRLLAPTQKGSSPDLAEWISLDSLKKNAIRFLKDSVSSSLSPEIDRIDVRPSNGIVKFTFRDHFKGLQLDGVTGKLLSVETRKSDFIEQIHDGSIVDRIFGLGKDQAKVSYNLIMGTSLTLLVVSGFWLWYGPKRLRKIRRNSHI